MRARYPYSSQRSPHFLPEEPRGADVGALVQRRVAPCQSPPQHVDHYPPVKGGD